MRSTLEYLQRKLFSLVQRQKPRQAPRFVKPHLEALEERVVLDAMVFAGGGTPLLPAAWNAVANWTDLTNPANPHIPTSSDDVGIPGGAVVLLSGANAEVNSIVTVGLSSLTIASGTELKIDNNPPATEPPDMPVSPTPGSNFFGGSVIDAGRINANTTNPFTGTQVIFAGGALIGPGDLNGSLDAGPVSAFTFLAPAVGSPILNTFAVGATLGPGPGSVIIAGPVTIDGTLDDSTMTMVLSGGILSGPTATTGTLDEKATLSWLGGSDALGGGTTIESSGQVLGSGPGFKGLAGTLTNLSAFSRLDGAGTLSLGVAGVGPGTIVNAAGTIEMSLPSITGTAGSSLTNTALGTLQETASSSAPTVISAPFTNNGIVSVTSGAALVLSNTVPGAPADTLDGVLQLLGNMTLRGAFTSLHGFLEQAAPGFLEVGGAGGVTPATLTVPSGVTDTLDGNLEVNSGSTLTGGGEVLNAGRLQLDLSSSTAGLGSYQQTSIGTLALAVGGGFGTPAVLAVTGKAQLSGTLLLLGYTPKVGAKFTVVTAGSIGADFDTIPHGMVETDGPTSVTVTQF